MNLIERLNHYDYFVFFLIFIITIFSIFYGKRSASKVQNDYLDYVLMGRKLTLPLFIFTLVATWYGGVLGVTEIAFQSGIYNFITQGLFWYLSYIIFAFFLVDKIRANDAITLADLVGKMFGHKSEKVAAIFNYFNIVPTAYAIGCALLIQSLFNFAFIESLIIGVSVITLYSLWGGFRAIVYSDMIQFFVMCLSVLLVVIFSYYKFGGLTYLKSNLPAQHFSITGGHSLATLTVWGFIALSTLVDPNFYQRCFAAKSSQIAKKGILISTLIWFIFDICTTLGGMYAFAKVSHIDSKYAYMTYSIDLLPHGVKGLFLAGLFASIASTFDSYIFLAGTTLSHDLLPKKFKESLNAHHIGVITSAFLSIILAIYFEGSIMNVWKTLGSLSASCLLAPVMFGHLYPNVIDDRKFIITTTLSAIGSIAWRNFPKVGICNQIDELYIGLFLSGILLSFFKLTHQQSAKK